MNDDTISRKAVIDAVHTAMYGFICGAEDGDEMTDADKLVLSINKAVCNAIKALPSVQQRWIPVTEALPEYDFTDVLICLHDVRHGCENDYYIIQAYTVRGHWKPTLDINVDDLDVVAWMPLPPVYEGGQE